MYFDTNLISQSMYIIGFFLLILSYTYFRLLCWMPKSCRAWECRHCVRRGKQTVTRHPPRPPQIWLLLTCRPVYRYYPQTHIIDIYIYIERERERERDWKKNKQDPYPMNRGDKNTIAIQSLNLIKLSIFFYVSGLSVGIDSRFLNTL